MSAQWQKVRELFDSALQQKPEVRREFVNHACRDDKALLADVESLLSSLDSAESFMETPAVACQQGDYVKAHSLYKECLVIYHVFADKHGIASALDGLADLVAAQDQPQCAARLLGTSEYIYEATGTRPNLADRAIRDRAVANSRAALGEESYAAALGKGRELPLEEAIAHALGQSLG